MQGSRFLKIDHINVNRAIFGAAADQITHVSIIIDKPSVYSDDFIEVCAVSDTLWTSEPRQNGPLSAGDGLDRDLE